MGDEEFVARGAVARLTAENSLAAATLIKRGQVRSRAAHISADSPGRTFQVLTDRIWTKDLATDKKKEFMFVMAAPELVGAAQSPIHPIAVA